MPPRPSSTGTPLPSRSSEKCANSDGGAGLGGGAGAGLPSKVSIGSEASPSSPSSIAKESAQRGQSAAAACQVPHSGHLAPVSTPTSALDSNAIRGGCIGSTREWEALFQVFFREDFYVGD